MFVGRKVGILYVQEADNFSEMLLEIFGNARFPIFPIFELYNIDEELLKACCRIGLR